MELTCYVGNREDLVNHYMDHEIRLWNRLDAGLPLFRGSIEIPQILLKIFFFLGIKILKTFDCFFFWGSKYSPFDKVPWILSLPGGSPVKVRKVTSFCFECLQLNFTLFHPPFPYLHGKSTKQKWQLMYIY